MVPSGFVTKCVASSGTMASAGDSVAEFIARYTPAVAKQFRTARTHVRKRFPRGYELVYDNYNALGIGFSATSRGSDIVVSVVAYPRWVTLFFFKATHLPDPEHLLQGSGTRIRSIRLQPIDLLRSAGVRDLLSHAVHSVSADLAAAPRLRTIVKSVSARRRPRRPEVSG